MIRLLIIVVLCATLVACQNNALLTFYDDANCTNPIVTISQNQVNICIYELFGCLELGPGQYISAKCVTGNPTRDDYIEAYGKPAIASTYYGMSCPVQESSTVNIRFYIDGKCVGSDFSGAEGPVIFKYQNGNITQTIYTNSTNCTNLDESGAIILNLGLDCQGGYNFEYVNAVVGTSSVLSTYTGFPCTANNIVSTKVTLGTTCTTGSVGSCTQSSNGQFTISSCISGSSRTYADQVIGYNAVAYANYSSPNCPSSNNPTTITYVPNGDCYSTSGGASVLNTCFAVESIGTFSLNLNSTRYESSSTCSGSSTYTNVSSDEYCSSSLSGSLEVYCIGEYSVYAYQSESYYTGYGCGAGSETPTAYQFVDIYFPNQICPESEPCSNNTQKNTSTIQTCQYVTEVPSKDDVTRTLSQRTGVMDSYVAISYWAGSVCVNDPLAYIYIATDGCYPTILSTGVYGCTNEGKAYVDYYSTSNCSEGSFANRTTFEPNQCYTYISSSPISLVYSCISTSNPPPITSGFVTSGGLTTSVAPLTSTSSGSSNSTSTGSTSSTGATNSTSATSTTGGTSATSAASTSSQSSTTGQVSSATKCIYSIIAFIAIVITL